MPDYSATQNWGQNIPVEIGDLIQWSGYGAVQIRSASFSADTACLDLPSGSVYRFERATNIQVRTQRGSRVEFSVIKGL